MYTVCSLPILAVLGHNPEEGRLLAGLFKMSYPYQSRQITFSFSRFFAQLDRQLQH